MGLSSPSPQSKAARAGMVACEMAGQRAVLNAPLLPVMGLRLVGLVLVGCSLGFGVAMGQPSPAVAQTAAEATAKPRLKVDGVLDARSKTFKSGEHHQIHTFEGQAGEKLTIDLSSREFDPAVAIATAQKQLAHNIGTRTGNAMISLTLPTTGTYSILVTSTQPKQQGRYQLEVRATTSTDFALAEAEQLNQRSFDLYEAGKYQEAISFSEKALQIRQRILAHHPAIASSLNNLGVLYEKQGR
jgi:tetratricopeptide (TPR) repeat protein